ncbi:MAG: type II toxin-antitoxin system Phd/YefM family antitoxin [Chloroflexi bacterium]|nr:type II toxin-antitoxin system Phd/YefM family antitoxin [Chloroflexota bacterium]
MPTRIVTVSELKTKLGALMAELEKRGVPLYVTQHGKPKAVVARYDEYEALLQKLEDLEDILAMKEALEAPEEESMTLEEFERQRAARVRG